MESLAVLDHLAVSARDLAEGSAWVEATLGVPTEQGGRHPSMATHNRLLSLGEGEYLEVIAPDPDQPAPPYPRWFRLDERTGPPQLTNWVVRVPDLDRAIVAAPQGVGAATDLARGDYRWRMAVPRDGRLPFGDLFPGLIQWQGDRHPARSLPDRGCRLLGLEVSHPEADRLRQAVGLADPRVVFVPGAAALRATILTPHGARLLG